jgi:hypothetical protein
MATCPVCKTDQIPVKKDGDLYKHVRLDGERCDNISTTLEVKNDTGKSESVLDKDQPEEHAESVTNVISEADLPKEKTFKFTLTLTLPATYINDPAWHQSNKELAESRARRAGMTPTGAPRYEGAVERGRKVVLTYEVPVK